VSIRAAFSDPIIKLTFHGTYQKGEHRNVVVIYQDPANKSHTGTGHSVRDQLNQVLAECNLGAIDGSNDRIGGWLLLYELLSRGALAHRRYLPVADRRNPQPST
jgi:hypothetical protein